MQQGRAILSLMQGEHVDVVWTMTSRKREKQLLPIRIPLLKGLQGYRIFIINENDNEKFNKISTLEDLRELVAGQGRDMIGLILKFCRLTK